MSSDSDSELSVVPTEELLGELANRHIDMVFVGRSPISNDADGPPVCGVVKYFHGDQYVCVGLAQDAIHCIISGSFRE